MFRSGETTEPAGVTPPQDGAPATFPEADERRYAAGQEVLTRARALRTTNGAGVLTAEDSIRLVLAEDKELAQRYLGYR